MSAPPAAPALKPPVSVSQAWLRALERTAAIPRHPERLLSTIVDEMAARRGEAPAVLSDTQCFTYAELAARKDRYAQWALAQGIARGDVVALLMPNSPEYLAVWLGITSVGGVVALLNTNLDVAALTHAMTAAAAQHLLASDEYAAVAASAARACPQPPQLSRPLGPDAPPGEGPVPAQYRPPTIEDTALYIYTSGTTGLPKAARVSHARILQWSHWFAGMMDAGPEDRMYNCLPMYHSVGGVQAPGATLVSGGALILREKFSAGRFWSDIVRWDCTIFQYIGELCRYLVHAAPSPQEGEHRLRLACGNGLAPEVWQRFEERFHIPQILEFYASTEGGLSLFNVEGRRGSLGRIPAYLAHRFAPALVAVDPETAEPRRDRDGFCVRVGVDEPGEAIARLQEDPAHVGTRFEGYVDEAATRRKVLTHAFAEGDAWLRTGDLLRKDAQGFYYFVDRLGDTFRWKGENVATSEVSAVLAGFPGILHAIVYGVAVPGAEGRAGMAAITASTPLDLSALRVYLGERLPAYARPLFLRLQTAIEVTGTFKYRKADLVREGFDPSAIDASTACLYFDHLALGSFVPLDRNLYDQIRAGEIRL